MLRTQLYTLQIHYENKRVIADKILNDLKALPYIETRCVPFVQFATKLKHAMEAFKSLGLVGYLFVPDLIEAISDKVPSSLRYFYSEKCELDIFSEFLSIQAER